MTIRVYNTLTKQKEEFVPVHPGKANIYVCGVTPYNHPHIGNARPFVTWDVNRRCLEHEGYDVLHVQNFTDKKEKIINTPAELGFYSRFFRIAQGLKNGPGAIGNHGNFLRRHLIMGNQISFAVLSHTNDMRGLF